MTSRRLRRLLQAGFSILLLAGLYLVRIRSDGGGGPPSGPIGRSSAPRSSAPTPAPTGTSLIEAYRAHRSNIELAIGGRVTRVLADDRDGSRHQRFLVSVADQVSVLVAHNVDLAPRVPLAPGDSVELRGEYEWNDRGGVMHWTHRDPDGRHEAGWIRHDGRLYQ